MEYRILGPLEVWDGDRLIELTSVPQRVVLAMLLLHPDQVISVDRLVDELWEEHTPSRPREAVHAYVYRLRRLLGDRRNGGSVLDTRRGGYLLRAAADALDLGRWDRLVADGAAGIGAGRLAGGAARLREALALWRGPALADVATATVRARGCWLDERRWEALEQCLAAELALGRHRALISELEQLVAGQPLRESLSAKLMLALYRAGRPADALASYGRLRRRLVEELGIEPSAELQQLHLQMLRADPALAAAGPVAGVTPETRIAAVERPRELPRDVTAFVGRDAELAATLALLQRAGDTPSTVVVAIDGPAGAGKSALAIHAAHRTAGQFPDGQLYVNLLGATPGQRPQRPGDVLARFLRALGVAPEHVPAEVDEAAARFRSLTAGRRLLIVLDDAAAASQVRPLLPAGPGGAVLVTSRSSLTTLDGVERVRLGRLPAAGALTMLGRLTGSRRSAGPDPPGQLERLAGLCDHLPLALRIAAARLTARDDLTVPDLVAKLADARRRLDELSTDDIAVRASLQVGFDELGADLAESLAILAGLDVVDLDGPAAAAALGRSPEWAEPTLAALVNASLLEAARPGRYQLHDLPRLFIREQTSGRPDGTQAVTRVFRYYLATVENAMRQLYPALVRGELPWLAGAPARSFTDAAAAGRWLDIEELNVLGTARQAADCPAVPVGAFPAMLAWLGTYSEKRGHRQEWYAAGHAVLARARRDGDRPVEARILGNLGVVAVRHQRLEEACQHLEAAQVLMRAYGDRLSLARVQNALAQAYEPLGRYHQAEAALREAERTFAELGNQRGGAVVWNNLGRLYTASGQPERALPHLRRARRLLVDLDDRVDAAYVANSLGDTYRALGLLRVATACYRYGLAQSRRHGSVLGEAYALAGLGRLHRAARSFDRAADLLRQALVLYQRLDAPLDRAALLRDLAGVGTG